MTISYNWLTEYLPGAEADKPDPETLSDLLTAIGLEVESLDKYEQISGSLEGLVIGKVLEVRPHPGADRLQITQVDVGGEGPLKIVCGAPNVAEGQQVVVAPVGTTIHPQKGDPLTMKKAKIRGEESFGMICAEDEIGLGDSHDGIMVLSEVVPAGTPARSYFQPAEDWIYTIGLTPNRMDAMSHLGVARDLCAKLSHDTGRSWRPEPASVDGFSVSNNTLPVRVVIENETACPRYTGLSIKNVQVGPSPRWLRQRLEAIGVRPINNVVDITNYVLHECGQPLHAFDLQAVKGAEIRVKNLPAGTPFVTLDGQSRKLDAEDLMICNATEGMCLAGIFGGLDSGVTEQTTAIFLESACFDPVSIRRSSFRHGLRTDAAIRFEKGVDISGLQYALKRAALLMTEYCGAEVASEIVDVYPAPRPRTRLLLEKQYLHRLSGKAFSLAEAATILRDLGFRINPPTEDTLEVEAPYSKPDMSVPADLVEEIMRIDGYDNVAIPTHFKMAPSATPATTLEGPREAITAYLTDSGFYEIMTNSITNSRYYDAEVPLVRLLNNLSSELDVMRPSLMETGLEVVAYNLNRRQENLLFFELGRVYAPEGEQEKPVLALYASGNQRGGSWRGKAPAVDPYFLKAHVQHLLSRLGIVSGRVRFVPRQLTRLQQALEIVVGETSIGQLGRVSKKDLQRFDIAQAVWYVEMDLSCLQQLLPQSPASYAPIARFPEVRRDLALILDKKVHFSEVERVANEIKTRILEEVNLFDVFEGEQLGEAKKSYAVRFVFRHPERTLTDKEIDKVMHRLMQAFEKQLGAAIRS